MAELGKYSDAIRDMTWSYSRINSFDDCQYRWLLHYIIYPDYPGIENFFASYGTFMHELLADFYRGEKSAFELQVEYLTQFRERVTGRAPNQKVFDNYFSDGLQYLKTLKPSENKVLAVEQKFEIDFFMHPGKLIGYIDLIEQMPDGSIIITDHKSRDLKPRSKREKPTKTDEELDLYLRQLYIYSAYIGQTFMQMPALLCINSFRKGVMIQEPFNMKAFAQAKSWGSAEQKRIENETDFRPDIEYFKCNYLCDMREVCEYYQIAKGT